ncbi:MAG TPA: FAD binding domain-containing protein [Candidatus Limnocylindrales bacterium]|nr:FAD binding domain-containing protein [Candidatus Limnocylindrales bacterium]
MTVADYYLPRSVPEALGLLGAHGPELLVIAGGTVAMPLINEGISLPTRVMGLRMAGMDRVERTDAALVIGATATLTRLLQQDEVPMLREAASRTASWSVRNMGTVGGNLFTPPPGGDVATALLALDATVTLTGPAGSRVLPLAAFWTGFMTTDLAPDELVTSISVPVDAGRTTFIKFGRKQDNTPSVVTVAVHLAMAGGGQTVAGARIALGAVGPHPVRMARAEAALAGARLDEAAIAEAVAAAAADCEPFTDAVASDWYRRRMVGVFVRRALESLRTTGKDA